MKAALRFGRYCSAALAAAGGDWLVFSVLVSAVGVAPLTSLMTARVAGGLLSFLCNRYWTWGANRQIALTQQGRRFVLLYAFSYTLSVALFRLLSEVLFFPPYPSKFATDLSCFVINFVVMNSYVFHARAGLRQLSIPSAIAFAAPEQQTKMRDYTDRTARPAPEPKAFWDSKILGWESTRYGRPESSDLIEGLAGQISSSVRFRLDAAVRLLAPHLAGRRVVELGCGSGRLAERLLLLGAASYQGYDFSEVAIARAKQRAAASPRGEAMRFAVAAVADAPPQGDALLISFGLIEWLTPAELDRLFALGRQGSCLHALSERRRSATQFIHRAYVHFAYGRINGGYVPRYHQVEEIAAIANRHGIGPLGVFRHRRMRFGIFVSDLPLEWSGRC
jgi:putative flippase GtrA/SAM-dependent methyltransferase